MFKNALFDIDESRVAWRPDLVKTKLADLFTHLDYGDYRHASARRYFDISYMDVNSTLQARVLNCTFGLVTGIVQKKFGLKENEPIVVHPDLD